MSQNWKLHVKINNSTTCGERINFFKSNSQFGTYDVIFHVFVNGLKKKVIPLKAFAVFLAFQLSFFIQKCLHHSVIKSGHFRLKVYFVLYSKCAWYGVTFSLLASIILSLRHTLKYFPVYQLIIKNIFCRER